MVVVGIFEMVSNQRRLGFNPIDIQTKHQVSMRLSTLIGPRFAFLINDIPNSLPGQTVLPDQCANILVDIGSRALVRGKLSDARIGRPISPEKYCHNTGARNELPR